MSVEAPAAPVEQSPMPNMQEAFLRALPAEKREKYQEKTPEQKAPVEKQAEQKSAEQKQPESKVDRKQPEQKQVEVKPAKKKNALDSMLDESPVTEEKPIEGDEVAALIAAENPDWKKARDSLKKQSEELKVLREKVSKAAEPAPEVMQQLKTFQQERDKLNAENKELRDAITALDVKYDPQHRAKYIDGRTKIIEKAAARVKAAGGNDTAFREAMEASGERRTALLRDALGEITEDYQRAPITAMLGQVEVLEDERDEMMADPQKSWESLKQQREVEASRKQQAIEELKRATLERIGKDLSRVSKFMRMAPEDAEGAKEYNEQFTQDMQRAGTFLSDNLSPEDVTVAAYKAARYDSMEKMLVQSRQEMNQMREELERFHSADPSFVGGGHTKQVNNLDRPIGEVFEEALRKKRSTI